MIKISFHHHDLGFAPSPCTAWFNFRRAFTLIELILVLTILALAAAVAAPSLIGFARGRESADTAVRMLSLIRYAQTQSAALSTSYRFNIDPDSGQYWLTVQRGGTFADLADDLGKTFTLPTNASFAWEVAPPTTAGQNHLQFDPDGWHDIGAIKLTGGDKSVRYIAAASPSEPFVITDTAPTPVAAQLIAPNHNAGVIP